MLLFSPLLSQQKVLFYIDHDGRQTLVPINTQTYIKSGIDHYPEGILRKELSGVVDTLRYFDSFNEGSELNTIFGFNGMDIAFQWYAAPVEMVIREFWWRNSIETGNSGEAEIRVWRVNKRIFDIPLNAVNNSGIMGFYPHDCDTCEYSISPFRPDTNSIFATNSTDTTNLFFDPLLDEWLPGRLEVTLEPDSWQNIVLPNSTDNHFYLKEMEPFGFTIRNTNPPSIPGERIQIRAKQVSPPGSTDHFSPYHSLKFYSTGSPIDSAVGWQVKNFDWGMFVVADILTDGPFLTFDFLGLEEPLQSESEQKISVIIKNFGGLAQPTVIKDVYLKYKTDSAPIFNSIEMTAAADTFSAVFPISEEGKAIFAYMVVNDVMGNRFHSNVVSYSIVTSINDDKSSPWGFALYQNYPNPFNPATTIKYEIPALLDVRTGVDPKVSGSNRLQSSRHMSLHQMHVKLVIYDILGREMKTLVNEYQNPGFYEIEFNAGNLPTGVYLYRLSAGDPSTTSGQGFVEVKRMILLK